VARAAAELGIGSLARFFPFKFHVFVYNARRFRSPEESRGIKNNGFPLTGLTFEQVGYAASAMSWPKFGQLPLGH